MRVVGIGASAGGLEAIRELFERLDELPGGDEAAWIVVVHLDPTSVSTLDAHLQTFTSMPVVQVKETMALLAGRVHVIPPGQGLVIEGATLRLESLPDRAHRAPIDRLFESLAHEKGHDAAAVILSGMGSDGTKGALSVGRAGGLVLVQDPRDALYDGMPLSAIESGATRTEGTVAELAKALSVWARHETASDDDPEAVARILRCVVRETAHDFSDYRKSSLLRRIHHRMAAVPVRDIREYASRIESDPAEAHELVADVLIGVTRFFRDPEAFEALATEVIGPMLDSKTRETLRIWVAGCATGEEAYSIAILCLERMATMKNPPALQIFGTDIDRPALEVARRGVYGGEIEQHVSRARLERFFTAVEGGYSISSDVHKACLFSEHDLLRDPPFSRLDLVSCRNVLIYLGPEAKERVLQIFHYALVPDGCLFLGPAEGVPRDMPLFVPVDASRNLHRRTAAAPSAPPAVFGLSGPPSRRFTERYAPRPISEHARLVRQVERSLLEELAPPAVAVDERHRVLFFVGETKPFLALPAGAPPTDDLLELAAKPIRHELAVAFRAAKEQQAEVRRAVSFHDAEGTSVEIVVRPLRAPAGSSAAFLVAFRGSSPSTQQLPSTLAPGTDAAILLETELRETRSQLEAMVEDLEQSNDELKTSNEELQSLNEEFQSANEELQTSQEELQSMNEELRTLNQEFVQKVADLDRANADINNLFASTDVGSVFLLNRDLTIHRFTPHATRLFRLLDTDRGRPITDIATRFEGCDVIVAAKQVLATLEDFEARVFEREGARWYIVRIHPYRTLEGNVDGVVMTFIDVSDLQREITEREAAENQLRAVFEAEAAGNAEISVPSGHIIRSNATFVRLARIEARDLAATRLEDLVTPDDRGVLSSVLADLAHDGKPVPQVELRFGREGEAPVWVQFSMAPVDVAEGEDGRAVVVAIDITAQHELEAKLVQARKVEALGRLAGGIAHDFNNLIAVALGHLEMMERGREKKRDIGANLAVIRQVLDRATELTRDLLAFGGRGKAAPRAFALPPMLRETERMLTRIISADVTLEVYVADDLWPVRADSAQVEQMLINLVINSRDASPRGGTIRIEAVNESVDKLTGAVTTNAKPGDYVKVSVQDAGTGMDAATLARCLDPYFTTKPPGKGTGLGLASVAGTAEQSGGLFQIQSEQGVGTTASIYLPRAPASEIAPDTKPRATPTLGEGTETVLLVEDEPMLLRLNREALTSFGYQVLTATDGAEALEVARAYDAPIHLVVSDVRMPNVDGGELARRLPSVRPGVPVLLVSGHPGEARVPKGVPFLAKPFRPTELVRRMRELLDAPQIAEDDASASSDRG